MAEQRKWIVAHTRNVNSDKITQFFITDALTNDELDDRPYAALFPISQKFDHDTQERRAWDYAGYLNKLEEAAQQAYANNQLCDILKS